MDLSSEFSYIGGDKATGEIINTAILARQQYGCNPAIFGDCKNVSKIVVSALNQKGIPAKLKGGQFITNPSEDEEWDHSWITIGSSVLDPTVDQFFSMLDIDLITEVPGIYYSELDGDWLKSRYR
jgi:hypothetical protein